MATASSVQWTGVLSFSPAATGDLAYIKDVKDKLDQIGELENNWDGEGGEPINQRILAIAGELLFPLSRIQPPVPRIAPVLGGGVQFEWRVQDRELEIEILPDGSVEYLTIEGRDTYEGRLPDLPKQEVVSLVTWLIRRRG